MKGDYIYLIGTIVQIVGFAEGVHVPVVGACLLVYGAAMLVLGLRQ